MQRMELVAMEQKLQMHANGQEVHQTLHDLDQQYRDTVVPAYFGPVRDWVGEVCKLDRESMDDGDALVRTFTMEMPFPSGDEARQHLAKVTWCHFFFKLTNDNLLPLEDEILDRYIRIAKVLYYNITDKAAVKAIGLKLHYFGGLEMQQSIFYTFVHLFPRLENSHGRDFGEIRSMAKSNIEVYWDGVGEWLL